MQMKRVCIFCGSSAGRSVEYAGLARDCGRILAARRLTLVYGGGNVGLMGILADSALQAGAEVIGVIPRKLVDRELAHHGVTSLVRVGSMHERKQKMAELSDAAIALPGGIGTMDELFEIYTWLQLRFHDKPVGLLNACGFYDLLLQFLDHMVQERFLRPENRELLLVDADFAKLLDRMASFCPRPVPRLKTKAPTP